jgi:preprotein translocase subunit SecA
VTPSLKLSGNQALIRPVPGVVWGDYPEREPADERGARNGLESALSVVAGTVLRPRVQPYREFAARVLERVATATVGEAALAPRLVALRSAWLSDGEAALLEACCLAAQALHTTLGMTPYPTQLVAARVMLDGHLAEMATGEGKTVAIALAAAVAALGGTPVHVVTANDYLAARDASSLGGFYAALGLRVGVVTYCTAKELVFDYLRDGLAQPRHGGALAVRARRMLAEPVEGVWAGVPLTPPLSQMARGSHSPQGPLLRGLCMAIIDEADTVLIDEARVPLVLSEAAPVPGDAAFLQAVLACASALTPGEHFQLQPVQARAVLTPAGRLRVQAFSFDGHPLHANAQHQHDSVQTALAALHLYERDRDYVVQNGKVLIVDETTGRSAPGRAWSRGLHQWVELREGVAVTQRNTTVTQITFQRFFRRYLRLAGMSGTVAGSAGELRAVYGLSTLRVPLRLPSRRITLPLALLPDHAHLWDAVLQITAAAHERGNPVLIGTASVAESEQLSARLAIAGLAHVVLNARQDKAEGDIVAAAGKRGRITVATSMAGRGTDIMLEPGVAEQGGLYVILCQHNSSRRIDRQFCGRCARQGQPGTVVTLLSATSPLFASWLPAWWIERAVRPQGVSQWVRDFTAFVPQWLEELSQSRQRQILCRLDEQTERELSFGKPSSHRSPQT